MGKYAHLSASGQVPSSQLGNALAALSVVAIPFTDGDSMRRVTITDAAVSAASKIVGTIRRPDTTDDSADKGFLYTANIVKLANGSFDLLVVCTVWGMADAVVSGLNETVYFVYVVG